MATYRVTDPDTGRTIRIEGDSPPTEKELNDIFSATKAPIPAGKAQGTMEGLKSFGRDVVENTARQAGDYIRAVPQLAKMAAIMSPMSAETLYPVQRLMGMPSEETMLSQKRNIIKSLPSTAVEGVLDAAGMFAHPITTIRERPIDAALTFIPAGKAAASGAKMGLRAAAASRPGLMARGLAKATKVAVGTPEEATLAQIKNPAAVRTAFGFDDLADQVAESAGRLDETIGMLNDAAKGTLRSSKYLNEGAIPKTQVIDVIRNAQRSIRSAVTKPRQAAKESLAKLARNIKGEGGKRGLNSTISEKRLKELIKDLDEDINWTDPSASATNKALAGVRMRIDDILKSQNPEYAKAIKPVAEAMKVRDKFGRTFGIGRETGRGYHVTDQTVNKLRSALKENRLETKNVLRRYESITGEDLQTRLANATAKAAMQEGRAQGSARAVVGGVTGEFVGQGMGLPPVIGGTIGAISGRIADAYGPKIAARVIDVIADPSNTRYARMFSEAAKQGGNRVVQIHTLLQATDPEYMAKIGGARKPARIR